jgi:hypothetical protein
VIHGRLAFLIVALSVSVSIMPVYARKDDQKKQTTAILRVETGLLSVDINTSLHSHLRRSEQVEVKKAGQIPVRSDQVSASLNIILFSGDQILKSRECGDHKCLLKVSDRESRQLISQNLHTNLPQRTELNEEGNRVETPLVGPLPTLRIALINHVTLTKLKSDQKQVELDDLSVESKLLWVDAVHFEVSNQILRVDEVSVVKEPVFIPTKLVNLIEDLDCSGAQCLLTRSGIELFSVDPKRSKLKIKLRLKREVTISGSNKNRAIITQKIPLRRCSISTPKVPVLGGIRQHKILLAIARGCGAGKYRSINVKTWPPTRAHISQELLIEDPSWRYFELMIHETPSQGDQLEVSLLRQRRREVLLGTVNISLKHSFQPKQIRLKIDRLGQADFIPTNQEAKLALAYDDSSWLTLLKPKSFVGFYALTHQIDNKVKAETKVKAQSKGKNYLIRADQGASGQVPLLMSYVPKFQGHFSLFNQKIRELATFRTETRYTLRRVNTPITLTESSESKAVVEVSCYTPKKRLKITPRKIFLLPFESRHSCRVTIHKDRIPKWAGKQHILVTEDHEKFRRVVTASNGVGDIVISIPVKKSKEFDRLEIGVGHNYSSAQYDFAPQQDLGAESRYEIVLGDRSFGVSLSTSLPTGLFRYGFSADDRSSVALSAGGLGRLLWLWREGRPFPVGIDFGMLVTGIDEEPHLSFIGGLGVSVPVLNANTPFEASFNLHAWLEYAPTRTEEGRSPWTLLFGPSFAVGKFSTNL